MTTSVSGLRAQSYALENISDNVANSQTVGYKRVDTSFKDMVPDYPLEQQVGGSVMAFAAARTPSPAISCRRHLHQYGDHRQLVLRRPQVCRHVGRTVFSSNDLYTRRGDFTLDKDGYLVNGAGLSLRQRARSDHGRSGGSAANRSNSRRRGAGARQHDRAVHGQPAVIPKTANYDPSVPGSDLYTGASAVTAALEPNFMKETSTGAAP